MSEVTTNATEWLARAREGDEPAARLLVEQLYPVVMGVIRRRLPQRMDGEDLAQEVFLKIFRHLPEFRGEATSLPAWARTIALRVCLNAWRHQKARPELRWADLTEDEQTRMESVLTAAETVEAGHRVFALDLLRRLLDTLEAKDRMVIELVELEQLSLAEVARTLGWSAVNVRVRAFRARRKLRHALSRLLRQGPHERPD